MSIVIGITGSAGSGKDTFSNMVANTDSSFIKVSFAKIVKDVLSSIFVWDRELLEGLTDESRVWRETVDVFWSDRLNIKDFTPRKAMQMIGTDVMRVHLSDNIWVNALEKTIDPLIKENKNIIITDVRFKNEIELIDSLSGTIIEIRGSMPEYYSLALSHSTNEEERTKKMTELFPDVHVSEYEWIGLNHPQYIVENNGPIEKLEFVAGDILHRIKGSYGS